MHRVVNIIHKASAVAMLMIVGCATLPEDFDRSESYALTDTENTTFGRSRAAERAAHPGKSGFHLLANGLDAFVARALLAQGADPLRLDVIVYRSRRNADHAWHRKQ